jgi:hypothetical protein
MKNCFLSTHNPFTLILLNAFTLRLGKCKCQKIGKVSENYLPVVADYSLGWNLIEAFWWPYLTLE